MNDSKKIEVIIKFYPAFQEADVSKDELHLIESHLYNILKELFIETELQEE